MATESLVQADSQRSFCEPSELPLGIAHKKFAGEALTEEEQAEWEAYEQAASAAEHQRELLGLVDLAQVMVDGSTAPEMLIPNLLVKGEHHLMYGAKESAKTWIALWAVVELIRAHHTAVWVDKEMGRRNTADRLATLGLHPAMVRKHFVYCEYPTMDCSQESVTYWRALLEACRPSLMVVDAQTEVLADANLNENVGTDIEKWMKAYITPARRTGVASLMLDHTGLAEGGRAVASRQKGAAAKVEFEVKKIAKFDRKRLGHVEVVLRKNTMGANLTDSRYVEIGGDKSRDGMFVMNWTDVAPRPNDAIAREDAKLEKLAAALADAGDEGLTETQARNVVGGKKSSVQKLLDKLAHDDDWPVDVRRGSRVNSSRWVWVAVQ